MLANIVILLNKICQKVGAESEERQHNDKEGTF